MIIKVQIFVILSLTEVFDQLKVWPVRVIRIHPLGTNLPWIAFKILSTDQQSQLRLQREGQKVKFFLMI